MDSFFGIGLFELVMIAVIALLVLGPERLPGAMREVAKWIRQARNLSGELQSQFSEEFKLLDEMNPRRIINEALDPNAPAARPKPAPAPPAKPTLVTPAAKPPGAKPPIPGPKSAAPAAAGMVAGMTAGDETQNTILPPPAAAPATGTEQAPAEQAAPNSSPAAAAPDVAAIATASPPPAPAAVSSDPEAVQ